jgi:PAS domain S-box-containing protein
MEANSHKEGSGDEMGVDSRYQSIIEAVQDGIFIISPNGNITYANDVVEKFTGVERNELIGATFETLVESELLRPEEYDRFCTSISDLDEREIQQKHLTFETEHEDSRVIDVRLSKHTRNDGTKEIVGVVRDVTERERRVEDAEKKQEALANLYEIGADASLTFEQKAERILAIGCDYLDLPYGFLTRVEKDVQQVVHAVGDHELLQPDESAPLEKSYCRKTVESDGLVGMKDAKKELGENDQAYELFELGCYIGTKVLVGENLYGTFCFAAPHNREREFTSGEREVIKLLGQWAGYELERLRFEERMRGLHRISQRLLSAETTEEVADITVELGSDILKLPVAAYWEYDPSSDALCPLAETEEAAQIIEETPAFERGDTLLWESFDTGEIRSYEDVTERQGVYPGTGPRSEVYVPCGNHGVMMSAATEARAFDKIDIETLGLLKDIATEAMTAVKREQRLSERGELLQRQNERLEEFADVVAHDLRNPLTGAVGSLEIARETNDPHFFDRAEQSLERMDGLIDELLGIARGDRQKVSLRTLSLNSIVEEAWSYTDAQDATLSVDGPLGEIRADETRLLQLFGNLFRNSVEHGGDDVTVEVGLLTNEEGFYLADDGPGLEDGTRTAIEESGDLDRESSTGIGLMSITDVVEEHGWDISVPDTEIGARFEVRTDQESG